MKPSEVIDSYIGIAELLDHYGIEVRHNRFRCPVHNGTDMNCTIGSNPKVFTCFVCNKSFSNIALVMERENCDFNRAVSLIGEWFQIHELTRELTDEERVAWLVRQKERKAAQEREADRLADEFMKQAPIHRKKANDYIKALTKTDKSHKYLAGRGISKELCNKYGVRDCRIKVGDKLEDAIMVPYSRSPDEVWCWRRSIESKQFRKTNSDYLGEEPMFNHVAFQQALRTGDKIFVTESPLDCMSAEQIYGCKGVTYVSIGGVMLGKIWKSINDVKPFKIVCGFDNDEVGDNAAADLEKECVARGITYQRFVFDRDCKDINDYLKKLTGTPT